MNPFHIKPRIFTWKIKFTLPQIFLFLIGVLFLPFSLAEHYPTLHTVNEGAGDAYISQDAKNQNFGADTILQTKAKDSNSKKRVAFVGFNLDSATKFPNVIDVSNWAYIEKAELVFDIENAQCPVDGCELQAIPLLDRFTEGDGVSGEGVTWECATDADISDNNARCAQAWSADNTGPDTAPKLTIADGATGSIRFDITGDVISLSKDNGGPENLNVAWMIKAKKGSVNLYSREAANESIQPPRIEVTNFPVNDTVFPAREVVVVNGIDMTYYQIDPPDGTPFKGDVVLIHGIPFSGDTWRNTAPLLADRGYRVTVIDLVGTGPNWANKPALPEFTYTWREQRDQISGALDALGLIAGVNIKGHEAASLPVMDLVILEPWRFNTVAAAEAWLSFCPPELNMGSDNPPPPDGNGLCSVDSAINQFLPFPDGMGGFVTVDFWQLWEFVLVRPSTQAACGFMYSCCASEIAVQAFEPRPLGQDLLDRYTAPFPLELDEAGLPTCETAFNLPLMPMSLAVPGFTEDPDTRIMYDRVNSSLPALSLPKFLGVSDPGVFHSVEAQLEYADSHFGIDVVGLCASGHSPMESCYKATADRYGSWLDLHN